MRARKKSCVHTSYRIRMSQPNHRRFEWISPASSLVRSHSLKRHLVGWFSFDIILYLVGCDYRDAVHMTCDRRAENKYKQYIARFAQEYKLRSTASPAICNRSDILVSVVDTQMLLFTFRMHNLIHIYNFIIFRILFFSPLVVRLDAGALVAWLVRI